ncbi:MAG: tRNA (adenosine(37)-N6)-dimethylallyltransferase MiaA [Candidatus Phytoplasma stylosanthis]|uniref:tRNA (adenosine(37)-N6)-dimethylallyltransferase MiaA n=1 Tax=Candidatus Phytoplasma stylosanthis TaxID=2798314 RepID=UPI00293A2A6C|nr:tRNA (adenosine(37)-N6)-dimethylallyltransferase MiaA [Candidatus Phytoplasma stylosanthis]MDV3167799.1 tRNA (adenosine(37)-N6)-dimethylallyltransferase MiaA [Candidatus Phytoplasma stylosanthis]MDV3170924.1 tRNA (adenosine(37)-N6)-dimethylallyltransferase MiaA [Candidatus Phytoplasma stylosanthis]MDV3173670.1 tRNA (adenosine(37)-N6)-dimethylallyltransferase MiaA [Candidatus Phytoplasma stylosanthis]MDV3174358.1 tRNA (adenosine(37)-N6)-dimethylallyltransferase MiaA [Candidatus Phytoplasma st
MKKVIVITGPTSSGKTDLSIELAKLFKAEIINADSVQIYKKFDIGSSKITLEETQNIKHHLISKINPEACYNVYNFQKDTRKLISKIKVPFLVGGSGLYIKAALFDYEFVKEKKNIKSNNLNLSQMLKIIEQKDSNLILDKSNPHRIIRAYQQTFQKKLRSQKNGKNKPLFDILFLYLDIPRDILKKRIVARLEKMIQKGFIQEVEYLVKNHPQANFNIIGYKEIKDFLDKKKDLIETKKIIITKSIQYAKRQKTWFKNQIPSLKLINPLEKNAKEVAKNIIKNFLKEGNK